MNNLHTVLVRQCTYLIGSLLKEVRESGPAQ